jgi:hypothetical protein
VGALVGADLRMISAAHCQHLVGSTAYGFHPTVVGLDSSLDTSTAAAAALEHGQHPMTLLPEGCSVPFCAARMLTNTATRPPTLFTYTDASQKAAGAVLASHSSPDLYMPCPASVVTDFLHPAAACSSTPGCVVVPRVVTKGSADLCVSQHFNKLSKDQMNQFMVGLTLAEPAVVGSCDGACWMRQVRLRGGGGLREEGGGGKHVWGGGDVNGRHSMPQGCVRLCVVMDEECEVCKARLITCVAPGVSAELAALRSST